MVRKASGIIAAQDYSDPSDAKYTYTIVEDYNIAKEDDQSESKMMEEENTTLPNSV